MRRDEVEGSEKTVPAESDIVHSGTTIELIADVSGA
jgi:hypothetical protein